MAQVCNNVIKNKEGQTTFSLEMSCLQFNFTVYIEPRIYCVQIKSIPWIQNGNSAFSGNSASLILRHFPGIRYMVYSLYMAMYLLVYNKIWQKVMCCVVKESSIIHCNELVVNLQLFVTRQGPDKDSVRIESAFIIKLKVNSTIAIRIFVFIIRE